MKVYFTCSVRGSETLKDEYIKIYECLVKLGHTHVVNSPYEKFLRTLDQSTIYSSVQQENIDLYKNAIRGINSAEIIVMEITTHSLAMGFVMQQALNSGKPVIAMYKEGVKPAFAISIENEKLFLIEYQKSNLEMQLAEAIKTAEEQIDVRFNFFISPAIGTYLDWISKVKKIPRSVYLRALIEQEMNQNKEYQSTL